MIPHDITYIHISCLNMQWLRDALLMVCDAKKDLDKWQDDVPGRAMTAYHMHLPFNERTFVCTKRTNKIRKQV